jgi:hypothetical protein
LNTAVRQAVGSSAQAMCMYSFPLPE